MVGKDGYSFNDDIKGVSLLKMLFQHYAIHK